MLTLAINALYARVAREARCKGKNLIETTVLHFGNVAVTTTFNTLLGQVIGVAGPALLSGLDAAAAARIGFRAAQMGDLAPEAPPPAAAERAQPTI